MKNKICVLRLGLLAAAAACALCFAPAGYAAERELVPIGRCAGIKILSRGAVVSEPAPFASGGNQVSPCEEAGLKPGDVIIRLGGRDVCDAGDLRSATESCGESSVRITVLREGGELELRITPRRSDADGSVRIGAYVRDSMAGIGTVTYYDPATGEFGALGHAITDGETGIAMPIGSGSLVYAEISGVKRGEAGTPGELIGSYDALRGGGSLTKNCDTGLYGSVGADELYPGLFCAEAIPTGDAVPGRAEILSNISGETVCRYTAEILSVENGSTKNLRIRVTDPALLKVTGGIVQGMSGSPILQNGRLVGAVTHVLVQEPTEGFGIKIENMLSGADDNVGISIKFDNIGLIAA